MMPVRFRDRRDAGMRLAAKLRTWAARPDVVVLGLPRGGVSVAFEVAKGLDVPLDVFTVRKLAVPGRTDLAIGAIASGSVRVLNEAVVRSLGLPSDAVDAVALREQRELARREAIYRGARPPLPLADRTCILVADGVDTGNSLRAAIEALRQHHPSRVIVAVPACSRDAANTLRRVADELVTVTPPEPIEVRGTSYEDFRAIGDREVTALLAASRSVPVAGDR